MPDYKPVMFDHRNDDHKALLAWVNRLCDVHQGRQPLDLTARIFMVDRMLQAAYVAVEEMKR